MPRHLDLAAKYGVNLLGAVTWAFEFEDQAVVRRLPRPGHQRRRQARAQRLPHAGHDDRRPRRGHGPGGAAARSHAGRRVRRTKPDVHAMASVDAHSRGGADLQLSRQFASPAPPRPSIWPSPGCRAAACWCSISAWTTSTATPTKPGSRWARRNSPPPSSTRSWKPPANSRPWTRRAGRHSTDGRLRLNFDLPLHGVSLILVTW